MTISSTTKPTPDGPLPETLEDAHALIRSLRLEVADLDGKVDDLQSHVRAFEADEDQRQEEIAWGDTILERLRQTAQRFHERQRHPGTLDWTRCHHDVCDDLSRSLKDLLIGRGRSQW